VIECFSSRLWMDAKVFLFEHRNLWWVGKVQCTLQSRDLYQSAIGTDAYTGASAVLKICKHLDIFTLLWHIHFGAMRRISLCLCSIH
jgi:hypothetical protein